MRKLLLCLGLMVHAIAFSQTTYYVDNSLGNDTYAGTLAKPWKSVTKVNKFNFAPGDKLLFKGGQTFGQIQLQFDDGGLTISSYDGTATVSGLYAYNVGDITIDGVKFVGAGNVNTLDGINFYMDASAPGDLNNINIKNTSVSNFGGNGILVGAWATSNGYNNVQVLNSTMYLNGIDGFASYGYYDQVNNTNLYIKDSKAYQNYGRTDITSTHTGSGFVVGGFNGGTIEYCEAYQNGKNNRYPGGGPQGFWCYNSKSIIFQYSTSHDNKAGNRFDGGGFDIDGGSQNSIIQYCYSYNNDGAGYAFFEHGSTTQFTNNTIRYNISQNDARANAHGGIMLWAQDTLNRVKNSYIYNNSIYTTTSSLASAGFPVGVYFKWSNFQNLYYYNNIVYTTDTIKTLVGNTAATTFSNNGYWTQGGSVYNKKGGVAVNPLFKNPGGGKDGYRLWGTSTMINAGKATTVTKDIVGAPVPSNGGYDIGAYEANYIAPKVNAGTDQNVVLPATSTTLNGSATDDGTIIKYTWSKTSGPSQYTFGSPNAASTTVSNLAQGTYIFRITAYDNDSAKGYDDIQVVVSTSPSSGGTKYVKVNIYGGSNAYANAEWNNWKVSSTTLTSTAFKYSDGTASTASAVLSASSAISDNGTTYGGTMAPPEVLRYCSAANVARTLTFNGLSASKKYNLELYASKNTTGYSTIFTIGTTSITIKTDFNLTNVASFTNLTPNASGQIVLNIKSSSSYNFLNGFILTEVSSATTAIQTEPGSIGAAEENGLKVQVASNPASDHFNLTIKSQSYAPVHLRIVDALGRTVEIKEKIAPNTMVPIGATYKPGLYFAEVIQNHNKATVRLVKESLR